MLQCGTVQQFDETNGVGLIRTPLGALLFVHLDAVAPGHRLVVGQTVAYRVRNGQRGWEAVQVRPVTLPPQH